MRLSSRLPVCIDLTNEITVFHCVQAWQKHLLLWVLYVLFKVLLNLSGESMMDVSSFVPLLEIQLVLLCVKVPAVYAGLYGMNQFFNRSISVYRLLGLFIGLLFLAVVSMSALNHYIILPHILNLSSPYSLWNTGSLIYHAFQLLFVMGMATALKLAGRQYDATFTQIMLQKEKTENELKYLKSQINPHFLFNTLNNIYSLARKGSEHTADSVLKLSQLMRFMLHEASKSTIPLHEEIAIIENYVELEKLRYTSRLRVNLETKLDDPLQPIAPLLLIHFVENAFKHGASETGSEAEVNVQITLKNRLLSADIRNTINRTTASSDLKIGMENIKRQLQLIYPQHQLKVAATEHEFHVHLTLSL